MIYHGVRALMVIFTMILITLSYLFIDKGMYLEGFMLGIVVLFTTGMMLVDNNHYRNIKSNNKDLDQIDYL